MKIAEINKILKSTNRGLGDIKERMNQKMQALDYDIVIATYTTEAQFNKQVIDTPIGQLGNTDNCRNCLKNGGKVVAVKFKNGDKFPFVADYTDVPFVLVDFDPKETTLKNAPNCVPKLEVQEFVNKRFIPDAIRIGEDKYLFAPKYYSPGPFQHRNNFSIVTLDQLVLTVDFYYNHAKSMSHADAILQRDRNIEQYLSYDRARRESVYSYRFRYNDLPAATKKKISEEQWKSYTLEQKEAVSYPFKMLPKKVATKFGKEGNSMPTSYHLMYENVVDPTATRNRGYANTTVFNYYRVFQQFLAWKIIDFQHIRRAYAETNSKAFETSFGLSNTSKALQKDYGILVKRQNGDTIAPVEIEDIRLSMDMIFQTFGDFREIIRKQQLVVSHANKTHMYASSAIGLFIPRLPAVGISRIGGIRQFYSTASHEFAHYLDFFTNNGGNWLSGWYESMNYESLAGKIAITFREKMKREGKASEYITSTVECFARAMQQYFTMKWFPDFEFGHFSMINIENPRIITATPWYCSKEEFEKNVEPLVIQWIENKGFKKHKSKTQNIEIMDPLPINNSESDRSRNIRILKLKYKYTQ